MILDARDPSVDLSRSAQIAIVGAGPVGLTLARELAEIAPVLLVESGGFDIDDEVQSLQVGESVGIPYPLTETRARAFGGSSGLWAGYCALFDPHDFLERDWVPHSGWPFGVGAIEPYYQKAADLLNLGELNFDPHDITARAGVVLPLDNDIVSPSVWRFGVPTMRIGELEREQVEESPNLTTLIHANVVDIRLDAAHSMVSELVVRTLEGREGRISAEIFVLACGGIETPRILLNANRQVPQGLGNGNDLVGRCFMEHPHLSITSLDLEDPGRFECWAERGNYGDELEFLSCLGLRAQVQQDMEILNARAHIYRTPSMSDDDTPKVGVFLEQAPNPESRISLSETRDSLGMRQVRLDWRLTELDRRTYERTALGIGGEFERIRAGRMQGPLGYPPPLHSNHHLGTTRMSQSPSEGVVDPDCRVHDYGNLYVAGGSVFPTVSWANPTFTVIALSMRLADHLRSRIDSTLQSLAAVHGGQGATDRSRSLCDG